MRFVSVLYTIENGLLKYTNNKWPIGPVSHTWFLPYILLYQTMTKVRYMPNINAFRPVVHKEDIFKGFYYARGPRGLSRSPEKYV